jgi:hypothetical protein
MTTIHVFPNSGHHYTFVPLAKEALARFPQLKGLCEQDKQPWRPMNYRWVQGRFSTHNKQIGLWVAVESNVGGVRRGSIYEPRRAAEPTPGAANENPSPYAVADVTRLPSDDEPPITLKIPLPPPAEPGTMLEVAQFRVIWKRASSEHIDVDLIIDFGNTRTVVLALENTNANDGRLSSVCHPIRFIKPGQDYEAFAGRNRADDTSAIVDSWFVLHEPTFSNLEPPSSGFLPVLEWDATEEKVGGGMFSSPKIEKRHFVTARVPQMFVELSPVVMGDSARNILGTLSITQGGNYSMSSPKRYTWDNDPIGKDKDGREHWTMVLNRWNPKAKSVQQLPTLAGAMLRFLPADGRDWSIDRPPHEEPDQSRRPVANPPTPSYPRSDAMTWAALGIFELAYRQITSEEWRRENQEFVPRRLRNVTVTFPSGWSVQESVAYRQKWEKALDIFTLAHLEDKRSVTDGGDRPTLLMDLDEAVASQLPFVYSEIHRLGDQGENWIELFGRGQKLDARVRIMTVDIGGGTTDISIVEYNDALEGGVDLKATLLFRDSSSVAGDTLTKNIIESVLLPLIGARYQDDSAKAEAFENIFQRFDLKSGTKAKWSRIVKLVFLPIIRQWLKDLSAGSYKNPDTDLPWSPESIMGAEGRLVDPNALAEFNQFCRETILEEDCLSESEPLIYQPEDIKKCIDRVFSPLIRSLAKYVAAFDVDLVTLSGKPSELPQVKLLLEEMLPILPQRIIQAKDFPAGPWYPMSSDNKIHDAKSVTAVGAALYRAIYNGRIPNWSITRLPGGSVVPPNSVLWGAMPAPNKPHEFRSLYLDAGEEQSTKSMLVGTSIGRKLFRSAAKPEQVYRLRWKDRDKWANVPHSVTLQVTLKRVLAPSPDEIESLDIDRVEGMAGGRAVSKEDVELQLRTLEGDEFWLDNGRFEILWPAHAY